MYVDRNDIILKTDFQPQRDLIRPFEKDEFNILIPTIEFYERIKKQLDFYFQSRKETK